MCCCSVALPIVFFLHHLMHWQRHCCCSWHIHKNCCEATICKELDSWSRNTILYHTASTVCSTKQILDHLPGGSGVELVAIIDCCCGGSSTVVESGRLDTSRHYTYVPPSLKHTHTHLHRCLTPHTPPQTLWRRWMGKAGREWKTTLNTPQTSWKVLTSIAKVCEDWANCFNNVLVHCITWVVPSICILCEDLHSLIMEHRTGRERVTYRCSHVPNLVHGHYLGVVRPVYHYNHIMYPCYTDWTLLLFEAQCIWSLILIPVFGYWQEDIWGCLGGEIRVLLLPFLSSTWLSFAVCDVTNICVINKKRY